MVIDDLHAFVKELGPEKALVSDGVHYTKEAYQRLGAKVAGEIIKALDEPEATREASCRWIKTPPTLDGKLDDPAWAGAEVIDRFPAYWNGTPSTPGATRARLVWDDQALYFAATMADTEIRSHGVGRNDRLWLGDVFEMFFRPDPDAPAYYEFQVNPRAAYLELAFPERGFDFDTLAARPPLGLKAVTHVEGRSNNNNPDIPDRSWTVEGMIPWSAFNPTGGKPSPGDTWRFALCRYDYGPEGTEPVLSSSAPLRRASFHRYEDYGRLNFEGPDR